MTFGRHLHMRKYCYIYVIKHFHHSRDMTLLLFTVDHIPTLLLSGYY